MLALSKLAQLLVVLTKRVLNFSSWVAQTCVLMKAQRYQPGHWAQSTVLCSAVCMLLVLVAMNLHNPYLDNDLKLVTVWAPNLVFVSLGVARGIQDFCTLFGKHKLEPHFFKTTLSCAGRHNRAQNRVAGSLQSASLLHPQV